MPGNSATHVPHSPSTSGTSAIVMGGSLAGLWAARVLAPHFDRVTVLERDLLTEEAGFRPGVPQGRHIHILLERGSTIMCRLFPGIGAELEAAGARSIDLTQEMRTKARGQWVPRFVGGRRSYACSRVLLEATVRRRVAALPNVTLRSDVRVQGLAEAAGRIGGVRIRRRETAEEEIEAADFVVDATGRETKTPLWLEELGYGPTMETVIDARLGYASRLYRPGTAADWHILMVAQHAPDDTRGGIIYGLEGGIWLVGLAGIMEDYPPTDEAGFEAFARSVDPEFYAALQGAEPMGKISGYRRTENRWRHFERLATWPDRFVAVGDAVCSFNPVYGQGMTVAAVAAEALDAALTRARGRLDGVARRYQRSYPRVVEPAWLLSSSTDLEWLGQQAATTPAERFAGWYLPRLLDAMVSDRTVHLAFIGVAHLSEPVTTLFRPNIMARVLRHGWRQRGRAAQPHIA